MSSEQFCYEAGKANQQNIGYGINLMGSQSHRQHSTLHGEAYRDEHGIQKDVSPMWQETFDAYQTKLAMGRVKQQLGVGE